MEYVVIKGCIPLFIAEESIKADESWMPALITPSILSILQVYFIELAVIECYAETPR